MEKEKSRALDVSYNAAAAAAAVVVLNTVWSFNIDHIDH